MRVWIVRCNFKDVVTCFFIIPKRIVKEITSRSSCIPSAIFDITFFLFETWIVVGFFDDTYKHINVGGIAGVTNVIACPSGHGTEKAPGARISLFIGFVDDDLVGVDIKPDFGRCPF